MILQFENVLSPEECQALRESFDAANVWIDGNETAAGYAKSKKNNLQGDRQDKAVKAGVKKITSTLNASNAIVAATRPKKIARILFNLYKEGMSYGQHTDAPYINGVRSDISFTLFLSAPDDYEGGELEIDSIGHKDLIKGNLGSIVLYPASTLHQVKTVTKGQRFCCIGWMQSWVKSQDDRALLISLEQIIQDAKNLNIKHQHTDENKNASINLNLNNLRNNLLRRFSD